MLITRTFIVLLVKVKLLFTLNQIFTSQFILVNGCILQVWVHCEVILCDVTDAFSECSQGCEVGRHRRSVDTPYGKPTRIMQGPIKLWESKTVAESGK